MIESINREDLIADNEDSPSTSMDLKASMKAELLSLYRMKERDLIQKSKLNWLNLGG